MVFYSELRGVALDAYNRMVKVLLEKAQKELRLDADGLVVRPLRPEDIGSSKTYFSVSTTADTWTNVVSTYKVADNRFVGINGFYNGEGVGEITQVKIVRASSEARYWNVIPIRNFENKTGYADDPVTIGQNTTITISVNCSTASTITDFDFIGAVVEKKGLLINPLL